MPVAQGASGTAFPWQEAMEAGLGLLRLSPQSFWVMTPRELAAALAPLTATGGAIPPQRADLAALMRRFPDWGTSQAQR
ncbi:rcc01693 family protein [Aurantimonas sp. C2-5-R2]|uniref:rcc01693 family protein n=1 Tax=unclassified Aurantimonas TaxID=2638230 RepID=UPI002E17599B|nr:MULTISPECIES: rcc01693 family protein [unclassified Aurantimonas]MEC5290683.1 rcc01693 family protein [Aurantimonas sp. C2-3-R2]MEC5324610.1 rcc01693 family protein [Aurantimonas sp. A3-2-R12]MEC5411748.1 rcc01693 family protein [Aurantimonas sp. C2-4-R8]